MARPDAGEVFPFLSPGRKLPIPHYNNLNNTQLPDDPDSAATVIAGKIVEDLAKA